MGQNITKEEATVLSTWKALLAQKGIKASDFGLRRMLLWSKRQGFEASPSVAFSVTAWEDVGKKLWDAISKGSKDAVDLATTWRLLSETLKDWKNECDKKEQEISTAVASLSVKQEQKETAGAVVGGKDSERDPEVSEVTEKMKTLQIVDESLQGSSCQTLTGQKQKLKKWKLPKDFLSALPSYKTPAQQLAEWEANEMPSPPPAPSAPPGTEEEYQSPRPTAPLYPSLLDSEDEEDKTVTPQLSKTSGGPPCQPKTHAEPWTLPPATVTVIPRNPSRFWAQVKNKAIEMGNWDLVERLDISSETVETASVSTPDESGLMAYPVFKAAEGTGQHDEHNPFAWKVVVDLRTNIAKYGLNSQEVMQLIRIINTDLLCPSDITHLAQIMFSPVQYSVFESNWRRAAEKAALGNMQLPQGDPRLGAGVDVLMGTGNVFSNPQIQAQWPPLLLEQCQRIGMQALIKTMEMSAPRQKYTVIRQGAREPFLQFVEKIAAALEKQVEDENLQQILCKQLAKDNANEDCQKIIEALPGDPSLADMVAACSKVGTVEHKVAALAAALKAKSTSKCYTCGKEGHVRANCPTAKQKEGKEPSGGVSKLTCNRCGKPGHFAKQCRSKFHINGHLMQGNCKKSAKGRAQTQIPYNPGNPFVAMTQNQNNPQTSQSPYVTSSQARPAEQLGWMYPPPTQ